MVGSVPVVAKPVSVLMALRAPSQPTTYRARSTPPPTSTEADSASWVTPVTCCPPACLYSVLGQVLLQRLLDLLLPGGQHRGQPAARRQLVAALAQVLQLGQVLHLSQAGNRQTPRDRDDRLEFPAQDLC